MIIKGLKLLKKQSTFTLQVRWTSMNYKLKDSVQILIDNEEIKPKKHPGIMPFLDCSLPKWIIEEIHKNLENVDKNDLFKESLKLSNYLRSRFPPVEQNEIKQTYLDIEKGILKIESDDLSNEEIEEKRRLVKPKVMKILKSNLYSWKPLEYNRINSLKYLIGRSAPEYSVLNTIFHEIKIRDSNFNPQTIFDFGSGIGSVLWAATNIWKNINEYMGIDISNDMNDLSQKIISELPSKVKGVFHRQYIPVSNIDYDIVVSAYSFIELPNIKQRLEVISRLWKKTKKYLVIVEFGTNSGFRVLNEAREFIDYMSKDPRFKSNYFIFAPCPHKMECPRFAENKTPCNFISKYLSPFFKFGKHESELFSYLVFKKDEPCEDHNWSRIVRPSIIRSGQVRCNVCTSNGKLENLIFTKKNKALYYCARKSGWGDRLPMEESSEKEENVKTNILEESNEKLKLKNNMIELKSQILKETNENFIKSNLKNEVEELISEIPEERIILNSADTIKLVLSQIFKESNKTLNSKDEIEKKID